MIRTRTVTGSGLVVPHSAEYSGFTFRETGGVNRGVIRVRNGNADGAILDSISIAAGDSKTAHYGAQGVLTDGIYVEIVSGTIEGAIRFGQ